MAEPKYFLDRSYLSTARQVTLAPFHSPSDKSTRLNLQHYIWTQSLGFLLHPTIQPHVHDGAAIADVATGTGVWLLNLASTVPPSVQLRGFDVELSQTCAPEWLPANVSMHEWDVREDVAAEHQGKYDIVHIRFVIPVVHQDPTPVLRRLISMLKPGGWLQWMEQDPYTFEPHTALANTPIPATQKLHDLMGAQLLRQAGPPPGWISGLAEMFSAAGLACVEVQRYDKPDWALNHFHDSVLMALDEMAPHFPDADLKAATAEGAREMYALGRRVALSGVGVVTIGRKKLDS